MKYTEHGIIKEQNQNHKTTAQHQQWNETKQQQDSVSYESVEAIETEAAKLFHFSYSVSNYLSIRLLLMLYMCKPNPVGPTQAKIWERTSVQTVNEHCDKISLQENTSQCKKWRKNTTNDEDEKEENKEEYMHAHPHTHNSVPVL